MLQWLTNRKKARSITFAEVITNSDFSRFLLVSHFARPFVKRFVLCYGTVVCPVCLSVCNVGLLWPNGWVDQDVTWYGGRPQPRPHCVRWGPSSPRKGAQQSHPLFDPCLSWPNGRPSQQLLSIKCRPITLHDRAAVSQRCKVTPFRISCHGVI